MTLPLFIGMALLAAAALALLLWPLFRNARNAGNIANISRSDLNVAVYRDQMKELERDRAAGTLADPAFTQSTQELQRRALADTAAADAAVAPARAKVSKSLIAGMLVVIPLAAALLYAWLGAPEASRESASSAVVADKHMDEMVAALSARLQKNPDDPKGWAMLARSYKALGRYDLAEQAFGHVGDMLDQDAALLADYAEVLARRANGDFTGKPQAALNKALQLDPDNPQVLTIAGIAAYQRQAYNDAADYWERVKATLPADSEQAQVVAASIAKARSLAGPGAATPASTIDSWIAKPGQAKPDAAVADSTAGGQADRKKSSANPAASAVAGRVTLAPALAAQVQPGDTVFIFARPVKGPRAPVAVMRTTAGALPLEFTLDDSVGMGEQFKLSALKPGDAVHVEARISKTGDVIAAPGDLFGSVEPVKPGARGLKLVIDRAIPPAPAAGGAAAPVAANAPKPLPPAAASPSGGAAKSALSGRVTLASALAAQVKPGDTLFVFARAVDGPRVPLAMLRATAAALPLEFKLDDSMAMSPQFSLSAVAAGAEVRVEARISKSGEALPKSGDLVGTTDPVKPGAKGLNIVIERAVP